MRCSPSVAPSTYPCGAAVWAWVIADPPIRPILTECYHSAPQASIASHIPGALDVVGQAAHVVSVTRAKRTSQLRTQTSEFVKVFGCRPHDGGSAHTRGRRTQTSNGGKPRWGNV